MSAKEHKKPTKRMPFGQLFADIPAKPRATATSKGGVVVEVMPANERNARMALRDPKTPPNLRAELERYLADRKKAELTDAQQWLNERDAGRGGGKAGRKNDDTNKVRAHIRELLLTHPQVAKHPKFKPAWLLVYRDEKITGKMADSTFLRHVRAEIKLQSSPTPESTIPI